VGREGPCHTRKRGEQAGAGVPQQGDQAARGNFRGEPACGERAVGASMAANKGSGVT